MIYIWTDKKWSILLNSLNNYTHLQLNWLKMDVNCGTLMYCKYCLCHLFIVRYTIKVCCCPSTLIVYACFSIWRRYHRNLRTDCLSTSPSPVSTQCSLYVDCNCANRVSCQGLLCYYGHGVLQE